MQNPLDNGCRPNNYYGVSQAAAMLGVSRPTIYKYIKDGFLKQSWHKTLMKSLIKGTEIIKFHNSIS